MRKGGIAEGRGGFAVKTNRFWLFPTFFHAQMEKAKPEARRWLDASKASLPGGTEPPSELKLEFFAEITDAAFVSDWAKIVALDPFHFWTEKTVRERFDWSKPTGVHVLIARVQKLDTPRQLLLTPEMSGCKSWVDVPVPFPFAEAASVLSDEGFAARREAILKIIS